MRDPKRIDEFCKHLAELWHLVPDWRFGQLISNVLGTYPGDIFFPEDDVMIKFFDSFFNQGSDLQKAKEGLAE